MFYDYTNKRSASFANFTTEGKTRSYRIVQRYKADKVRNPRRTLFSICSSHIATLYPLVSLCFCVSLRPVFDWTVLSVFLTGQCVCVCVCVFVFLFSVIIICNSIYIHLYI